MAVPGVITLTTSRRTSFVVFLGSIKILAGDQW